MMLAKKLKKSVKNDGVTDMKTLIAAVDKIGEDDNLGKLLDMVGESKNDNVKNHFPKNTRHRHYSFTFFPDFEIKTGDKPLNERDKEAYDKIYALYEKIFTSGSVKPIYLLGGFEICPHTGKFHVQSYIQFKNQIFINSVYEFIFNIFGKHFFIEACKGSDKDNFKYCSKDKDCIIFGQKDDIGKSRQGQRNDIVDVHEAIKANNGRITTIIREMPGFVRNRPSMEAFASEYINELELEKYKKETENTKLNAYQEVYKECLMNQNDRTLSWIWDINGGHGKSYFAKYMSAWHGAYACMNGKNADIFHSYKNQDVAIFNFTRSMDEYVNYSMLESFKDGHLFKSKYESNILIRSSVKVIVFANFPPSSKEMSLDRWQIIKINKDDDIEDIVLEVPKIEKKIKAAPLRKVVKLTMEQFNNGESDNESDISLIKDNKEFVEEKKIISSADQFIENFE